MSPLEEGFKESFKDDLLGTVLHSLFLLESTADIFSSALVETFIARGCFLGTSLVQVDVVFLDDPHPAGIVLGLGFAPHKILGFLLPLCIDELTLEEPSRFLTEIVAL